MAQLFYDENNPRKKREMRGDKTPIAMNDGPSTPIKHYNDVNQSGGGRFLPDFGAGRIGNVRLKKKGKA
tara:strand:+ start:290 stop:496 length:207 start_codon:yes stop_codon:yes gene_type:complete